MSRADQGKPNHELIYVVDEILSNRLPLAKVKVVLMAGLRAYEVLRNFFQSKNYSVIDSAFPYLLKVLNTVASTIVHSITVAGAALEYHQLPSFIG